MSFLQSLCDHCGFPVYPPDRSFLGREARCPNCDGIFLLKIHYQDSMVAAQLNLFRAPTAEPAFRRAAETPPPAALPQHDALEGNSEAAIETLEQGDFLPIPTRADFWNDDSGEDSEFAGIIDAGRRRSHTLLTRTAGPSETKRSPSRRSASFVDLPPRSVRESQHVFFERSPLADLPSQSSAAETPLDPLPCDDAPPPTIKPSPRLDDSTADAAHTDRSNAAPPAPQIAPSVALRNLLAPAWRILKCRLQAPNWRRPLRRICQISARMEVDLPDPQSALTLAALAAGATAGALLAGALELPELPTAAAIWGGGLLATSCLCRIRLR